MPPSSSSPPGYGREEPPNEDFHIYLLDQDQKVLEQIPIPYRNVEWGELRWQTFAFPAVEVPEKFFVALWFNAERTKGVFLGMDTNVKESHSYVGLPDKGFHKADQGYTGWSGGRHARERQEAQLSQGDHVRGRGEATDTESKGRCPHVPGTTHGAFSVEGTLGVDDGKVRLKKADGKTVAIPLDRLSKEDQDFLARQSGAKQEAVKAGEGQARELSHDDEPWPAIEHRRARACRAICGRRRRVACDFREPARSRYGEARPPKGISTSGSATNISSPSPRSTSPTVRTPACPGMEVVPHPAHARAAQVHRLLRLQPATTKGVYVELRRPRQ